jgi:hypothetical protein
VAAAVATVALILGLAQQPVRGAFNGSTNSTGSQVSTASTFCAVAGTSTATAVADSYVDQGNQSSTGGGNDTFVVVTGQVGSARRVYVRFDPMPSVPSGCTVTSATLKLFAESQVAGRTLGAYRADPSVATWTELGLNWINKPAALGTAATAVIPAGDQYVDWTVTALAKDIYALGNNGFVVRDQDETGGGAWQQFNSRAVATNKPQLVVTYG